MDHNLDHSLNLESGIEVDFGHSEDVIVSQGDITLTQNTDRQIPMEFEHIEEQVTLMETEDQGLISSEFIQMDSNYSLQEEQEDGANTEVVTSESDPLIGSEPMIDLQFEPQSMTASTSNVYTHQPMQAQYIAIAPVQAKTSTNQQSRAAAPVPRQVPIAPKPAAINKTQYIYSSNASKQYAIAPKPHTVAPGKALKKVSVGIMNKGNTVLAQIGKQVVMVPAGSAQKFKLMQSGGQTIQLISGKNVAGGAKPLLAKVLVQGQGGDQKSSMSDAPAVLTRLAPGCVPPGHDAQRYVTMHQKTVPISMANNVILSSPSKQRPPKPVQIIAVKSGSGSPQKLMISRGPGGAVQPTTKKVVISSNPNKQPQNVILRASTNKNLQIVKADGSVTSASASRAQIHQINVPGKGVQYIKLLTPQSAAAASAGKLQTAGNSGSPKILVPDGKGNLIQMSGDGKLATSQGQTMVVTSGPAPKPNKVASKPQQKLVRIAPFGPINPLQANPRSLQSLLVAGSEPEPERPAAAAPRQDSKAALRALIEDAVQEEPAPPELQVSFEQDTTTEEEVSVEDPELMQVKQEHPVIVIPSSQYYSQQSHQRRSESELDEHLRLNDSGNNQTSYESPSPQNNSDNELELLSSRARRACNCTKSQCLKLYCDCFANGEFCNRCNCNNCHNNLEHEELRQKAIRQCLDRNPNAFRPKIGKTKSGGPTTLRRHNKGCNCKRSGCLKNYCECYEAKIACTGMCKCVGCRNVEEAGARPARRDDVPLYRLHHDKPDKQPCSFMTSEVIEAVCQCLVAAGAGGAGGGECGAEGAPPEPRDPVHAVIEEFARCLQDIIAASRHPPQTLESNAC